MNKILVLILLVIVITLVGIGLHNVPSYLLLQVGEYFIAAPLWLAIDALLILIMLIYLFAKLFGGIAHAKQHWREHNKASLQAKQDQLIAQALTAWTREDHKTAAVKFKKLTKLNWLPEQSQAMMHKAQEFIIADKKRTKIKLS